MPSELPKTYEPAEVQARLDAALSAERCFHAEPDPSRPPYVIVIPPPNVTAALHLGHALNNTLQDVLVRVHRMRGHDAVWLPGTDHAGIATQAVVEKRVLAEEGRRRTSFGREEFVARIQAWKDEYEATILGQLRAMGCSCDWERTAFTMDPPRARAVREAFFRLFRDGLIYRGKRLVNWDPATQTALADDEVEMEEIDGHFYYLRYPFEDGSGHVTVATTRPETMLGDTAVAMNPRDPRAASLRGRRLRLPIVNRIVPMLEDDYVVLPVSLGGDQDDPKAQFATGFLKVTPAHDPNDYELGLRHRAAIGEDWLINVMAPDATISDQHGWPRADFDRGDAGFVLGLDRYEARKAVVEWFRKNGLLEDVKPYRHSVGHSYRSHVPVEPYLSDQWYVAVRKPIPGLGGSGEAAPGTQVPRDSLAGLALTALAPQEGAPRLRFVPDRYEKTYVNWNANLRDWCISRQLWWGHRIPVWSGQADRTRLDEALRGVDSAIAQDGAIVHVCLLDDSAAERIEALGLRRDADVLDTWFSSALWPMSTMGWPDETAELKAWNPTSVLCTAREIITLWVSRMVMFNRCFRGRLPFTDVFIHAMIQDGDGRKMSKSLGNGVDPLDIIATHGADAMRFTLASMATNTQDVRMPVEPDPRTGRNTSPRFDLGRNFCNKLWNAARFVLMSIDQTPVEPVDELRWSMADRWIVSRLNRTVEEANAALAEYRFDQYARACYDFFWRDFCDWYLEASKPQMKSASRGQTACVLASVLDASLRLLHPLTPYVTEALWELLNERRPQRGIPGRIECPSPQDGRFPRCCRAPWPGVGDVSQAAEFIFPRIQELVVAIRNVRNEHKADARRPVRVTIAAPGDAARQIEALRPAIELLATCALIGVGEGAAAPEGAVRAAAAGCDVFVEGLVDESVEQQRLARRREDLTRQVAALRSRLANPGYAAKAPPHLVKQTQDQLAEAEAELARLG